MYQDLKGKTAIVTASHRLEIWTRTNERGCEL